MRITLLASGCVAAHAGVASAAIVGGVLYSDSAWNAAATTAIGQDAHVFRMYMVHDSSSSEIFSTSDNFWTALPGHGVLFQDDLFGSQIHHAGQQVPGFWEFQPSSQWDSYVSIGRIAGGRTALDPNFIDDQDNAIGWLPNGIGNNAGWFNSGPADQAGRGRLPGETIAGDPGPTGEGDPPTTTIPANFNPNFWYTFAGQFTLIGGELPDPASFVDQFVFSPNLTNFPFPELIIQSPVEIFQGTLLVHWGNIGDLTPFTTPMIFGIPTPGAAALFGLAGLAGLRRRR